MKNENGQVLVLFILILPLLLLGGACIIDSSYMLYQKNRLDNINIDVLDSVKANAYISSGDIANLILKNDERIINDNISIDEYITIENHLMIDSLFGRLIGIKEYRVNSKKSIKVNNLEELVLDIDNIGNYDNTNNYLITNNNVKYLDGLVFNNSYLLVNNFNLGNNYKINLSFSYLDSGNLLELNDFGLSINDNKLLINNNFIYSLEMGKVYKLVLTNDSISINGESLVVNYSITSHNGNLLIGNGFVGKIDFIKIYNLRK